MNASTTTQRRVHRFAIFLAICTFLLVIAGGLVTSTDSGLAVPDWPLSYGQVMPPMVGGIFYEHGHRMVATCVGLLTALLAFWLWRTEERRWVRTLGWVALASVIAQGVLGGVTVLYLLPTPISVAHATIAQSFFALTVALAVVTAPSWRSVHPSPAAGYLRRTHFLSLAGVAVVFLQLILGGLMRHTNSGLAIPDFPLSYGAWTPPLDQSAMTAINEERLSLNLQPAEFSQLWIHFSHRVGGMLVLVVLIGLVVHIFRNFPSAANLREPALLISVLLPVQILLGALTIWTAKNIEVATAHVATGALLLGLTVLLAMRCHHFFILNETEEVGGLVPEGSRP